MNATQPGPFTAISDAANAALEEAHALVASGNLGDAVTIYRRNLATLDTTSPAWADHAVALAATLCLMAQRQADAGVALNQLDEAQALIGSALANLRSNAHSLARAVARTNLAAILLSRNTIAHDPHALMTAHVTLDGTETTFANHQDKAGLDWVRALRDQLIEQSERRTAPR